MVKNPPNCPGGGTISWVFTYKRKVELELGFNENKSG